MYFHRDLFKRKSSHSLDDVVSACLVVCGKATWREDGGKADERAVDTIRRYDLL